MKVVDVGLENGQDGAKEIMKGKVIVHFLGTCHREKQVKEDLCRMEETEVVTSCCNEVTSFLTLPSHPHVLMVQEKSFPIATK